MGKRTVFTKGKFGNNNFILEKSTEPRNKSAISSNMHSSQGTRK